MLIRRSGGFPLTAFYFFYFCALGAFLPYWGPWLEMRGVAPFDIGILTAAVQFSKILAPNLWGWVGQRRGYGRAVVQASLATALSFPLLGFAQDRFWPLLVITLVFSFFWSATLPLVDVATLVWAERTGRVYGRIRLWGSLGFITLSLGMGVLAAHSGMAVFLPVMTAFLLLGWWCSRHLPFPQEATVSGVRTPEPDFLYRLQDRGLWFFLLAGLLEQASHGAYYAFYSIDVERHGYGSGMVGLLWALAVLCEVVFFWFGDRWIRQMGLPATFFLAFLLTVFRWAMIGWWPGLLWIVLVQTLHAASYGAFHLAAVRWVYGHFPEELRSRGMALYASTVYGAGGALGALGAGWAWSHWGASGAFFSAAFVALLGLLFLFPAHGGDRALEKTA